VTALNCHSRLECGGSFCASNLKRLLGLKPGLICALYAALEAPLFHGDARMLVKSQARVTKGMVQVTLPIQARTGFWAEKINPNPP